MAGTVSNPSDKWCPYCGGIPPKQCIDAAHLECMTDRAETTTTTAAAAGGLSVPRGSDAVAVRQAAATAAGKPVRWARKDCNKPHRCPATSDPDNSPYRWERDLPGCRDGSCTAWLYNQPGWQWRTHRCPSCGVRTVPYVTRFIDPQWHLHNVRTMPRLGAAEARTAARDLIDTLRN